MQPFNITVYQDGLPLEFTVNRVNEIFEIIYSGKIIAALHPPGEDWRLLPLEEMLSEIPLYENDLANHEIDLLLHAPLVNQIIGAVENHLGTII